MSWETERKLRRYMAASPHENKVDTNEREVRAVAAGLWLQCVTTLKVEYTLAAFEDGLPFGSVHAKVAEEFTARFRNGSRALSSESIYTLLQPLARFCSSFVSAEEVGEFDAAYFDANPADSSICSISSSGIM